MSEKSTIDEVGFQGFEIQRYEMGPEPDSVMLEAVDGDYVRFGDHVSLVGRLNLQRSELREALEVETSRVEALRAKNANLKSRLDEEKRMVMALAGVLEEERRGRNGNARLQVATAALQGLLANAEGVGGRTPLVSCDDGYGFDCKGLARLAVEQADALLEELGLGTRDGIQHKDD